MEREWWSGVVGWEKTQWQKSNMEEGTNVVSLYHLLELMVINPVNSIIALPYQFNDLGVILNLHGQVYVVCQHRAQVLEPLQTKY